MLATSGDFRALDVLEDHQREFAVAPSRSRMPDTPNLGSTSRPIRTTLLGMLLFKELDKAAQIRREGELDRVFMAPA